MATTPRPRASKWAYAFIIMGHLTWNVVPVAAEFEKLTLQIKELVPSPTVVVDGGANVGEWSREVRTMFRSSSTHLVMVEANPLISSRLKKLAKELGNASAITAALAEKPGQVNFFVSEDDSKGNSMFKENSEYFDDARVLKVEARTLDDICEELGVLDHVDVLKLDVQGAELAALHGAEKILRHASIVTLELSIVEFNQGGTCYFEVDDFLRSKGFAL
mmetsp:Transcript_28081/g.39014  ORF Transcript_28081/g.39014 Transcript_28081/m.39014 type:complete len:219 (+) Transcript_28081:288-944(+)